MKLRYSFSHAIIYSSILYIFGLILGSIICFISQNSYQWFIFSHRVILGGIYSFLFCLDLMAILIISHFYFKKINLSLKSVLKFSFTIICYIFLIDLLLGLFLMIRYDNSKGLDLISSWYYFAHSSLFILIPFTLAYFHKKIW